MHRAGIPTSMLVEVYYLHVVEGDTQVTVSRGLEVA